MTNETKELSFDEFYNEVDKLKRKASKINLISGNVMVIVSTRIKPRRKG